MTSSFSQLRILRSMNQWGASVTTSIHSGATDSIGVSYRANAPGATKPGLYQAIITYTAVVNV